MTDEEYTKAYDAIDDEIFRKWNEVDKSGVTGEERTAKFNAIYDEEAERKRALNKEFWRGIQLGDGVTLTLWTDAEAFTVIRKTPCTITVQEDKATLKPGWKPEWVPGGFCGHCTNQNTQEYDYERDPNGRKVTLRWSDKRNCYVHKGYRSCTYGRHKFYDYNF